MTRSREGYSGNRPYCKAGNIPEVLWKGTPENSRLDELLILSSFFYAPKAKETKEKFGGKTAGRVKFERLSKQ